MLSKIRSLTIGILIIAASGCDGYYWLVHVPDEGDMSAADTISYAYSETTGTFSVKIDGGDTQSPYTRKVQAGGLKIYWESRCEDSCKYVFRRPCILSDTSVIYPGGFSADYYPLENNRKKSISNRYRKQGDDLNEISFGVAPGRVKIWLGYSTYYEGLGFLHFPIIANFGYVICGRDTISIDSIKFDATRKSPPKLRK